MQYILDKSVGSPIAKFSKTIELFKQLDSTLNSIYMRYDESLSVPEIEKMSIPTTDFEKWRGVTLYINLLDQQISTAKEVVAHYDPDSMHKILIVVKPETTVTN